MGPASRAGTWAGCAPKLAGSVRWCQEVGWRGKPSPACRGDEGCGGVDEALPCVSGESRCRGALCRGTAEVARHREEEEKYFFFFFLNPTVLTSKIKPPQSWNMGICSEKLHPARGCALREEEPKERSGRVNAIQEMQQQFCSGREPQQHSLRERPRKQSLTRATLCL